MSKTKSSYSDSVLMKIFNSKMRIKVLKFMFRNYPAGVGPRELAKRIQEPYEPVRLEMQTLEKIGLMKKSQS